jgi:putative endonuclease
MFYVYSLKCKDGHYVGCTNNLKVRVNRHNQGRVSATANRLPVSLDFYIAVVDKYVAFELERYLKSGSGRSFIKKHLV